MVVAGAVGGRRMASRATSRASIFSCAAAVRFAFDPTTEYDVGVMWTVNVLSD